MLNWAVDNHVLLELVELVDLRDLGVGFWRLYETFSMDAGDLCHIKGDDLYLGRSRIPISLSATHCGDSAHLRDFVILLSLLVDMLAGSRLLAAVEPALPENFEITTELADSIAFPVCWYRKNSADRLPVAEFICRVIPEDHPAFGRMFRRSEPNGFIRVMYLAVAPTPRLMAEAPEWLWHRKEAPESVDPAEVLRVAEAELALARESQEGEARYRAEYIEAWLNWRRGALWAEMRSGVTFHVW